MGFRLCFHAPYRGEYNVAGFAGERRAALEDAHTALLDVAASYGSVTVVVHGARSETRSRDALYADSVAYLHWVLDRYPSLVWALENLGPKPGTTKIGTERDEVLRVVEEVEHPQLGLCWDVGHDVLADRLSTPSTAWLRRVVHVHAHDVDEGGRDHYPLLYARVPYDTWLPALRETGFQGIVTLEIKGNQLRGRDPARIHRTLIESVATIDRLLTAPASPAEGREAME